MTQNQQEPTTVQVRWGLPSDVIDKIKKHRRRLSALHNRDISSDEAVTDMIRSIEIPERIELKQA